MNFNEWKVNQIRLGNLWYSKVTSGRTIKGDLVGIWKDKYRQKEKNAKKEGLKVFLSFEEYLYKAYESKLICPTQIGVKRTQYQLSRINDIGDYTESSCRFITKLENESEKSQDFQLFANKFNSNPYTKSAWLNADKIYSYWRQGYGRFTISTYLGFKNNIKFLGACNTIIHKRFKKGWVPNKDNNWIKWKEQCQKL